MSDSRKTRRLVRSKRRSSAAAEGGETPAAEAPEVGTGAGPLFAVVASGENVVMIHTITGQTWAMATDGHGPVWHPVEFSATAPRAPKPARRGKAGAERGAGGEAEPGANDAAD